MTGVIIGYARCSTAGSDVEVQRQALISLNVEPDRIYVDHGLSGSNRQRPALSQALEAAGRGDVFIVTKLDRLARSVRDARDLMDSLSDQGVTLQIGSVVHDPDDPTWKQFRDALAVVAEFESDLIRARTREGMAAARAKGNLKGRKPKLSVRQAALLVDRHAAGHHSPEKLAELFGISRATVYRTLKQNSER